MTDRTEPTDGLGPPPQPNDVGRERAIADALAHFDDLTVDGVLSPGDVGDELSRRRTQGRRMGAPQRWLAAAAFLLVLGVGGALVAQLVGDSDEQMTSQASGQAEGGAASPDEAARADRGAADQTELDQTETGQAGADASKPVEPSNAAPAAAAPAVGPLPDWLCELTARLGLDVCGG